jgi:hypothetical protein
MSQRLKRIKSTLGFDIQAEDGQIGSVDDYLFDSQTWTVRYMVAETGSWLADRQVLLSPEKLGQPDWDSEEFPVALTTEAVENAPPVESDMPVSRQSEMLLARHYGWTPYWTEGLMPDELGMSIAAEADTKSRKAVQAQTKSHLHGVKEVSGYHTHATDGDIGHVQDFIVDTDTWAIRYLLLDTRNWLPGKHVLIPPAWASEVDWAEARLHVNVDRQAVRESPEYDEDVPLTREVEEALYSHFDRMPYWAKT